MKPPRILLADDHALLIDGLRRLIERHYQLVGAVQDGQSLLSEAQRLKPDLVILDIAMPILNGLQAGKRLREQLPETRILYVSMYGDTPYVEEAMRIGASGYVLKQSGWAELSKAIDTVLAGGTYISQDVSSAAERPASLLPSSPTTPAVPLTDRQRQILKLVTAGYTAKEIGRMLHITSKTVEFHKGRLLRQLQLQSTVELARYALTHGLSNL
jgi:DNA-binding NarL/FixJ family response regulator